MNGYKAVYIISKLKGKSLKSIESELGLTRNSISSGAASGSAPNTARLAKMIGTCGYRLVAVPDDVVLPDDSFIID